MLHSDFYVDDLLSASQTLAEAIQFKKDVSSILQQAGYSQRKWASNNLELLATIPENLQETQNVLPLDKKDSVSTLGLLWNPTSNQFQVKCQITCTAEVHTTTKHSILSTVASVFDPLGLISPIIISCKIFSRNYGKKNSNRMNLFLLNCYINGFDCNSSYLMSDISLSTTKCYMLMPQTYSSMVLATVVNKPTALVCISVLLIYMEKLHVNYCVQYLKLHHSRKPHYQDWNFVVLFSLLSFTRKLTQLIS